MKDMNEMMIPEEVIMSKICLIRGVKVMLDRDLAEFSPLKSQIVTSSWGGHFRIFIDCNNEL